MSGEIDGIGMTMRQLLLEVYADVKAMRPQLEVLVSQDLDRRVKVLEADMATDRSTSEARVGFMRLGRDAITLMISLVAVITAIMALVGR